MSLLSLGFLLAFAPWPTETRAPAAAQESLPVAWAAFYVAAPTGRIPQLADGLTIRLESGDGTYSEVVRADDFNPVHIALNAGRLQFKNVPLDINVVLSILYSGPAGKDRFQSSFTFHAPQLNPVQELRAAKAWEIAGYMGDFTIDLASGKIQRSSRY